MWTEAEDDAFADLMERKAVEGLVSIAERFSSLWFLREDFSALTACLRSAFAFLRLVLTAWVDSSDGDELETCLRFLFAFKTAFSKVHIFGFTEGLEDLDVESS